MTQHGARNDLSDINDTPPSGRDVASDVPPRPGESGSQATEDGSPGAGSGAPDGEEAPRRWWPPKWMTDAGDRVALLIWFASHVGFLIYMYLAGPGRTTDPFLNRLTRWDAENFIAIADYGYDGPPGMQDSGKLPAFFPGMALLIKLLRPYISDARLATVLISLVSSAVLAVALSRLAESYRPGTGRYAVAALFLSPFAAFLYTGYSEALFLALAIPAWLLARKGRWEDAALCATFAASVRISGAFLAFGILVMFLIAKNGLREPGGLRRAPWLLLPGVPLVLYSAYQWSRTGDWLAYNTVQAQYWGRHPVWPWEALVNTWNRAGEVPTLTVSYYEEIIAAAVLLLLVIALAVFRRWPELAYIAPQALSFLALSEFYMSIGRASLTWFPLWIAIAIAGERRRWVWYLALGIMIPVMAINVGHFTTGAWIG
ncbi:mannosyltransferase family protein [Sphaerisporangium aureirubrum]|uniref:Mannosyltransferase family protein n=1 Tax=Sphaerisporangium aureirubrum TaxID=1544736 RepID=A0ABW1NNA2_9ACTN